MIALCTSKANVIRISPPSAQRVLQGPGARTATSRDAPAAPGRLRARGAWGALRDPGTIELYRGAPRLGRGVSERWGAWGALRDPPSSYVGEGAARRGSRRRPSPRR